VKKKNIYVPCDKYTPELSEVYPVDVLVVWMSTMKKIPQKIVIIETTRETASKLFSASVWKGFYFMLTRTKNMRSKNTTRAWVMLPYWTRNTWMKMRATFLYMMTISQ